MYTRLYYADRRENIIYGLRVILFPHLAASYRSGTPRCNSFCEKQNKTKLILRHLLTTAQCSGFVCYNMYK